MARYAFTIFLSALLLFVVQPMLGKFLLPWFGGGSAIWTTCMLFYQTLLLGGYAYSHVVTDRLSLRRQGVLHLVLLLASLLLLPITPALAHAPVASGTPVRGILLVLLVSAGAPFFMIATTAPLLQRWFSREYPQGKPYRLYALSNTGSMLGLLAYPFLLEPLIGLRTQTLLWSWGYLLFVAAAGWCAVRTIRHARDVPIEDGESCEPPVQSAASGKVADRLLWLALSACGSLLLLATTSRMTEDITPVPFLWVFPLGLYVLSFVICFERDRWYDRRIWAPCFVVAVVASIAMLFEGSYVHILIQLPLYSATLFLGCMVCHGELARLKPHPRYLTSFYLLVAAGGAAGGVLATIVFPRLLPEYWEYQIALLGTFALLALSLQRDPTLAARGPRSRWLARVTLFVAAASGIAFGVQIKQEREGWVAGTRNFYGVLGVYDYGVGLDSTRMLYHGAMFQGGQLLHEHYRKEPTTYFGWDSGVAVAIDYLRRGDTPPDGAPGTVDERGLHIGVIGLGVGTIAALATENDAVRFYEIDPDVIALSGQYFHYLDDSPAAQEIVLGDGRISMQRELETNRRQRFDVLALDAFNSDAVPAHLLTREAFEVYLQHLAPDGILAVHVSSIHLDLAPVVRAMADAFSMQAVRVVSRRDWDMLIEWSDWILVTNNEGFLHDERAQSYVTSWKRPRKELWTDDHSSLLPLVTRTWD